METVMNALPLIAAAAIAVALILYITIRSLLDYINAKSGRAYIVFKALASLSAWVIASCGWLYMSFAMVYWTGPFVDIGGEMRGAVSLFLLDLVYAAIGCGLALWVRHKSHDRP